MPDPDDTSALLGRFAARRCEDAFRILVARHTGMVHTAARRMLRGDEVQAREVTQTVFVELARRAASLPPGVVLGAWLHRVACAQAALLIRTESRRRHREATAAAINDSSPDADDAARSEIAPALDSELNRLSAADREALVLRFFENRGLRDVGAALGTSEDGARKRISRALEKLRARFIRQGITAPGAAALAVLMGERATRAAEPEVVSAAAQAGLAAPVSLPVNAGMVAGVLLKSAAVFGFAALGFAGGRAATARQSAAPAAIVIPPPAPPVVKTPVPPPAPPPSHLVTRLTVESAMLARIARASAAELATLFDHYHRDLSPPLFDLLCQRWASLDAAAALDHLRHQHDGSLSDFYAAWARAEFARALASAKQEGGMTKNDSIREIFATLLPREVEKFLALAEAEKSSHISPDSVTLAMRTLAAGGLDGALAVFATLKAPHLRTPAAELLASLKAAADPDEAIAWAKSMPDGKERESALRGAILAFVDRDPDRAIPLLPLMGNDRRNAAAVFVARALVKRDAASGLAWAAENLPVQNLEGSVTLLREASGLSAVDQLHAIRRFRERMVKEATHAVFLKSFDRTVSGGNIRTNDSNAVEDLRALSAESPDATRNVMIGVIAGKLSRTDLPLLMQALPSLPPDTQRAIAARLFVSSGLDAASRTPLLPFLQDGPETEAVAKAYFSDGRVSDLIRSFGHTLARNQPDNFDTTLEKVPEAHRSHFLRGALEGMAGRDTEAALARAAALPAADQPAATEGIAAHFARENEMAASQWIDEMPRGPVRDAATRGLCGPLAQSEPDSAWRWALSIGDGAMRVETLGSVYHQWAKKGREAAATALSATSLNAAERRAVQQFKP